MVSQKTIQYVTIFDFLHKNSEILSSSQILKIKNLLIFFVKMNDFNFFVVYCLNNSKFKKGAIL